MGFNSAFKGLRLFPNHFRIIIIIIIIIIITIINITDFVSCFVCVHVRNFRYRFCNWNCQQLNNNNNNNNNNHNNNNGTNNIIRYNFFVVV